jgi:hypothetical protein
MSKPVLATALVGLVVVSIPGPVQDNKFEYNKRAELDAQGNVYVSSDEGKLIRMADNGYCLEVRVADDSQTVGCMVRLKSEEPPQSLQLEIYLKGGNRHTIEPGAPIRDWHFWKAGQQVTVYSGSRDGSGTYALYDTASTRLVEKLAEPSDESMLPQWAKGQAQIQDDSVPMSAALTQERTKWIAKVLRQIGKVKPGMRRRDLLKVFTTEGGLSNRFQRTYVHVECPYIKVNVRFKATSSERNVLTEDPNDIIESISQPYLAWGVMD